MKKAMITIEVLVSMLILFLVVATSFSNIKFFNIINEKKDGYEEHYMNVLSLKDKLSSTICQTLQKQEGEFNGYSFLATCEKVQELRTYMKAIEDDEVSGNVGFHMMKLYKVTLNLKKENFSKEQSYYMTVAQKLNR